MAISPTRRVLTGAVAVLLVGAACSPPSSTHTRGSAGDADTAQFAAAADDERGTLVSDEPMELAEPLADVGAHGMRIKYQSTDADGAASEATGAVLVPSGAPPAGGWPVVSWGHGSLGRADSCAPSQHADLMGYGATILPELIKAGYAVTASDYAGLGTPGTQPASWRSHAHDMIDAVRAADQLDVPLSDTWVAAGHSEGGGSAIATNEAVADYGDGLDYRGAAAIAFSMPDVARQPDLLTTGGLLLMLADPQMQALWLNLLSGFKADHPELNLDDFLGPQAQELLPKVTSQCSAGPGSLIDTLSARQLPSQEFLPTDPANGDRLAELFASLNLPSSTGAGPMLHMIGENDVLTPDPDVQRMRDGLCGQGVPTTMASVPGADHDGTLRAGADQVIDWIDQRVAGADPPDDC